MNRSFLLSPRTATALCLVILSLVTAAVFSSVPSFDFVSFDDPVYVFRNIHVSQGLTGANMLWALGAVEAGFWQPVTWLSLMADVSLYGMAPGGFHLTNLLLHVFNTLLTFFLIRSLTNRRGVALGVSLLFAVHPLHVEPVAWISSRKDLLASAFGLLALLAYARYGRTERKPFYGYSLILFALSLAAKPSLAMLPFLMLLLDGWPLGRLCGDTAGAKRRRLIMLLLEKAPFLLLTAAVTLLTFAAEQQMGAVKSSADYPAGVRLGNAVVGYAVYLYQTLWPADLAVLYPHPGERPFWQILSALGLLLVLTVAAVRERRRRPYLLVGWLWYTMMLLPMAGFVQIGLHATADRYTYFPLTGIFLALMCFCAETFGGTGRRRIMLATAFAALIPLLGWYSWGQSAYWKNSVTLYRRAVAVTNGNFVAYNNLALALTDRGRLDEAVTALRTALAIKPDFPVGWNNLGVAYRRQGRLGEAENAFREALRLHPRYADALGNLGEALLQAGNPKGAMEAYIRATEVQPQNPGRQYDLGMLQMRLGKPEDAEASFSRALAMDRRYGEAHNALGLLYLSQGKEAAAERAFRDAVATRPDLSDGYNNLGILFAKRGQRDAAAENFRRAIVLNPRDDNARRNLEQVLGKGAVR